MIKVHGRGQVAKKRDREEKTKGKTKPKGGKD